MGLWALFGFSVVPDQAGSAAQMPVQTAPTGLLLRKQNMLSHLGNSHSSPNVERVLANACLQYSIPFKLHESPIASLFLH